MTTSARQATIDSRIVGRSTNYEISASHRTVSGNNILVAMLDAMTDYVMVLNEKRQIVAVNRTTLNALSLDRPDNLLGMRPGEAFGCMHATEGTEGCGTGLHCTTCGAVLSIVTAQKQNEQDSEECRLTIGAEGGIAYDLEVVTTPIQLEGESYFICSLKDISASKRRSILERVFFHDVINTAGGVHSLASVLAENDTIPQEQQQKYKKWMLNLSGQLINEIMQQQHLMAAEKGEFVIEVSEFQLSSVVEDVLTLYRNHDVAQMKQIHLESIPKGKLVSDETVVRRILGNMLKNALEAIKPEETVTVSCHSSDEAVVFKVHNPGVMPEVVQLQLFKRSFSTKAANGRGIGTYSIKLFSEKYLKGTISFTSRESDGTTFVLTLPHLTEIAGK